MPFCSASFCLSFTLICCFCQSACFIVIFAQNCDFIQLRFKITFFPIAVISTKSHFRESPFHFSTSRDASAARQIAAFPFIAPTAFHIARRTPQQICTCNCRNRWKFISFLMQLNGEFQTGAESGLPSPEDEEGGQRKPGRSFSAADPATLLLGDFWMAPWLDWLASARSRANGNGANGGGPGGAGGNGANSNGEDSMWGQFTACAPLQQRRGQSRDQRRLSNEYVSGKSLPLCHQDFSHGFLATSNTSLYHTHRRHILGTFLSILWGNKWNLAQNIRNLAFPIIK